MSGTPRPDIFPVGENTPRRKAVYPGLPFFMKRYIHGLIRRLKKISFRYKKHA